jgi:hypothetical protein
MSYQGIESLKPEGTAIPVVIRVLRKWLPHWQKDKLSYLFIDNKVHALELKKKNLHHGLTKILKKDIHVQGNTIQVAADRNKLELFNDRISVLQCYRISQYACVSKNLFMDVIDNLTEIVIGPATVIQPIPDSVTLPRTHFAFSEYTALQDRIDKNEVLTGLSLTLHSI